MLGHWSIKKLKRASVACITALLFGVESCAPQATIIRLAPEDLSGLKAAESVHAVHREMSPPLFVANAAMTMGALGFLVGGALGETQGGRIAREHQLKDPIHVMKAHFLAVLARDYGMKNVRVVEQARSDDKIEGLRADLKEGTVFIFETTGSGMSQPSGFSANYAYTYYSEVRLVRLADGKVLWQNNCRSRGNARESLSTFTADGAKLLKSEMEATANECARQLFDHFSGKAAR